MQLLFVVGFLAIFITIKFWLMPLWETFSILKNNKMPIAISQKINIEKQSSLKNALSVNMRSQLIKTAKESNVKLNSVSMLGNDIKEGIKVEKIKFQFIGSFVSVVDFLVNLVNLHAVFAISLLSMSHGDAGVEVNVLINFYHYGDL